VRGAADEALPGELCRAIYPQENTHLLARQDHNGFVDPDESAEVMGFIGDHPPQTHEPLRAQQPLCDTADGRMDSASPGASTASLRNAA